MATEASHGSASHGSYVQLAVLTAIAWLIFVGWASADQPSADQPRADQPRADEAPCDLVEGELGMAIDFDSDIVPLLTKHGCNAGACHGAVAGRGQFHLSLFGGNPDADFEAIVEAFQGRRVHLRDPESSLLLAKPSGRIAHGGGELFEPASPTATRLQQWIEHGAPRGTRKKLVSLRVEAKPIEVGKYRMQLQARATWDGSEEIDVTDRVRFTIDESDSLPWDPEHAIIELERPGRYIVLARYMQRVVPVVLERPWGERGGTNPCPEGSTGWIDAFIDERLDAMGLSCAREIDESAWMRRVSIDLTGRLPTIEQIDAFESIPPISRRSAWVDRLLASSEHTEYWSSRMARLLGMRGFPNEPQASDAFAAWLRRGVSEDRPFPEMARELLTSSGDSHRIGAANFARLSADPRSHAESVARIFMGVRLECAHCHDHPFDRWTQDDYHGLAAIFAGVDRGRMVRLGSRGEVTNLKTMQAARPRIPGERFIEEGELSDLGVASLTRWLVDSDNPYLARAMVNRIWHAMLGRGLVHPIDDFRETNPATHPELLEQLIAFYRANDYRLRPLLREIALSRVYARSGGASEANDPFYGSGMRRALEPEVLFDAIHDVLGTPAIDTKTGEAYRAVQWMDANLSHESLDILGRCSRPERCDASLESFGLERQLHWLQGDLLQKPLISGTTFFDRLIDLGEEDRNILDTAYRRVYARLPSPDEREHWLRGIPNQGPQRREWYQDWVWSLLSSSEFMYR